MVKPESVVSYPLKRSIILIDSFENIIPQMYIENQGQVICCYFIPLKATELIKVWAVVIF